MLPLGQPSLNTSKISSDCEQGRNWFQKVEGDDGVGGERSEPVQLEEGGGGL